MVDDMMQGLLGDGGFIKACMLCCSQDNGAYISPLFCMEQCRPQNGLYVCQFYKQGEWVKVIVDDRIPCRVGGVPGEATPIFARSKDAHELWPMIIEKAYAKLHGGYSRIVDMGVAYCLRDITGGRTNACALSEVATREEFVRLTDPPPHGGKMICMVFRHDPSNIVGDQGGCPASPLPENFDCHTT